MEGENPPPREETAESVSAERSVAVSSITGAAPTSRTTMLPFVPNLFACPCRLSIRFSVFHRMTPAAAVRALESSVLHPFTVNNRLHTFVHRDRQGRVSYMKLEASRKRDSTAGM